MRVLLTLVCVSVLRSVFVFLSYSSQGMLCLNLSSPCGRVPPGFQTTGLPEQASPTSAAHLLHGGGPRSWPWGYTSTLRCVEFIRDTTQSSSFVPGRALVTPHVPSVRALPTAGRDRAQLHPGAWALTWAWTMNPGLGPPEPPVCCLCVCVCTCAHVCTIERAFQVTCLCGFLNSWGSGRGAEEEEVTPLCGSSGALSAQGQPGSEDTRAWGASLAINRECNGFPWKYYTVYA